MGRAVLAWIPMVFLGVGNGILRVATYGRYMPELRAHQLSTLIGVCLVGAYAWLVTPWLGARRTTQAWATGAAWLVLTIAFEFGFGRYVAGNSWERLLHDYDILSGRVWMLFLVAIAIAPWIAFRLRGGKAERVP